ncbi:MAG TPA: AbrB/MazE/SpoVT family DNA-binding domain-containing protein, partial [Chromatiaceae bacterium]|nr:AbrB/MazE/SpoVT family DNA-binding domain-containing protein [Chromatiaceae bacterium]
MRKIFKTGNSFVIFLPRESLQLLGLQEGSEVNVAVDQDEGRIIIEQAQPPLADIDTEFARQLNDFIEQYRPALESLAIMRNGDLLSWAINRKERRGRKE